MPAAIKPRHKKKKPNLDVVTLIDGRRVEFDFSGRTVVSNDSRDHAFNFSWIDQRSQCHRSALTVLRGLCVGTDAGKIDPDSERRYPPRFRSRLTCPEFAIVGR